MYWDRIRFCNADAKQTQAYVKRMQICYLGRMFAMTIAVLLGSQVVHNWDNASNQHWLGPDWHANRLQDWHVQNNLVICSEVAGRLPMRTAHLLTATTDGEFTVQVTTGTVDSSLQSAKNAWSGFLIGVGNDEIDYRLTALTQCPITGRRRRWFP